MLSQWMVWFPSDFRDESMINRAKQMVKLIIIWHPASETRLNQLMQTLMTHLNAIEKHEKHLDRLVLVTDNRDHELLDMEYSATIFAQELTRIELEHLCFLGPEELVHAFAKDMKSSSQNLPTDEVETEAQEARERAARRTKNLQAYVDWFNRLSFLIATSVCQKKKKKLRVRVIEFWIEVARECVNIGNFNSLMGIITGLNMVPVARLKKTWTKIHSGKFDVLGHQMDPSSNFVSYRTTLQAAVSRSENATDKKQRVVIPFFSLLLKDLYFVNEGCASKLANGHINLEKARSLTEHVSQFMKWKDMECPYEKLNRVLDYLEKSPTFSSDQLEFESYQLEPPESQAEKDLYKELKTNFKKS